MGGMNQHVGAYYWCKRCLGHFRLESAYLKHQQHCTTNDVSTTVMTMPPEGTTLKFKSVTNQQDMPIVVFADFECIVERIDRQSGGHTHIYQQPRPVSVGWKLVDCSTTSRMSRTWMSPATTSGTFPAPHAVAAGPADEGADAKRAAED